MESVDLVLIGAIDRTGSRIAAARRAGDHSVRRIGRIHERLPAGPVTAILVLRLNAWLADARLPNLWPAGIFIHEQRVRRAIENLLQLARSPRRLIRRKRRRTVPK